MNNEKQEVKYGVFAMYDGGYSSFLHIDSTNRMSALWEARAYRAPNLLLIDQFGNQYVIRVAGKEQLIYPKGHCVSTLERSCRGCYYNTYTGRCIH